MSSPLEEGSRTTPGSNITLQMPAWATLMDYILVAGGGTGTYGSPNYTPGQPGYYGQALYGSVKVLPGLNMTYTVGNNAANSILHIGSTTITATQTTTRGTLSRTIDVTPLKVSDPGVADPWSKLIGLNGAGGAAGAAGDGTAGSGGAGGAGQSGALFWRFRIGAQEVRVGTQIATRIYIGTSAPDTIRIGTTQVWEKFLQ